MRERFFIGLIGVMMLADMFVFLVKFRQAYMPIASKLAPVAKGKP